MARGTIFFPSKHKGLSAVISIRNPEEARAGLLRLSRAWNSKRTTRAQKRLILRSVVLARNRAVALLKKRNLSRKERRETQQVIAIYDRWIRNHKLR